MFKTKAVRNPDNSISIHVTQYDKPYCVNTYPASWTVSHAEHDTQLDLADLYL